MTKINNGLDSPNSCKEMFLGFRVVYASFRHHSKILSWHTRCFQKHLVSKKLMPSQAIRSTWSESTSKSVLEVKVDYKLISYLYFEGCKLGSIFYLIVLSQET